MPNFTLGRSNESIIRGSNTLPSLPSSSKPLQSVSTPSFLQRTGGVTVSSGSTIGDLSNNSSDDVEDLSSQLNDLISGMFDTFMNNSQLYQDVKDTNIKEAEKSFNRQKELMQFQYDLERQMRSTQIQDTIEDLRKAGINPAVYFSQGGNGNASFGISSGSVNSASVNNPNSDTLSSLVDAYSAILTSVANNKNADSAILRSIIGAIGNIFSLSRNFSSSQSVSDITGNYTGRYTNNSTSRNYNYSMGRGY